MAKTPDFATEADLVAAFCELIAQRNERERSARTRRRQRESTWTIYHETGGYDLMLVEDQTGVQVGIEAKKVLNLKVINQVLPHRYSRSGPDYRAVLVPRQGMPPDLHAICEHIGIVVLSVYDMNGGAEAHYAYSKRPYVPMWRVTTELPDERSEWDFGTSHWQSWLPVERVKLPEYVPDVVGGKPAPVALTDWKIRAIKLLIVLERRGHVTRADMNALKISPTRWTAASYGFLLADKALKGYVACDNTPDLRAQHPVNYGQIEADADKWLKESGIDLG